MPLIALTPLGIDPGMRLLMSGKALREMTDGKLRLYIARAGDWLSLMNETGLLRQPRSPLRAAGRAREYPGRCPGPGLPGACWGASSAGGQRAGCIWERVPPSYRVHPGLTDGP